MAVYQSQDPERPYAGNRLAKIIDGHEIVPYGLANSLMVACGYQFTHNMLGDKLYANADGHGLRLKYIHGNSWQIEAQEV